MEAKSFEFTQTPDKKRLIIGLRWEPKPPSQRVINRSLLLSKYSRRAAWLMMPFAVVVYTCKLGLWLLLNALSKTPLFYTLKNNNFVAGGVPDLQLARPESVPVDVISGYQKIEKEIDFPDKREDDYLEYDLDLCCYIFDNSGNISASIEPFDNRNIDEYSSAFHSGNDTTGRGIHDDEDISIILNKVPDSYQKFLIVVKSDSSFDFHSLENTPVVRIIDSSTHHELITHPMPIFRDSAKNKYVYVFGILLRKDNNWLFSPIDNFIDETTDWQPYISDII